MARRLVLGVMAIVTMAVVPEVAEARVRVHAAFPAPRIAPVSLHLLPRGVYYYRAPYDLDVFYAEGFWWSLWDGGWYRAVDYDGPWVLVRTGLVPPVLLPLPPRVHAMLPGARVIGWNDWRVQHRYGHGYGRDRGHGPGFRHDRDPGFRHGRDERHVRDRDRRGDRGRERGPDVRRPPQREGHGTVRPDTGRNRGPGNRVGGNRGRSGNPGRGPAPRHSR